MFMVKPHAGVKISRKDFTFGEKLKDIEKVCGSPDWQSKNNMTGKERIRVEYSSLETFFGFNDKLELDFIETFTKKNITIDDVAFSLGEHFHVLKPKLDKLANDWVSHSAGMQSESLGVGFYVDGFQKEFEGYFEAFSVFPKSYYSR